MPLIYSENSNKGKLTLVLIHAFPLNRHMWKYQLTGLQDSVHVIAPDLPGFGESKRLQESPSINAYGKALFELLDSMGIEKAIFGGCSLGGYILFELWRMAPQRVSGLILCDTRAEADTPEVRKNREKSIEEVLTKGTSPLAEAMPLKLLSPTTYQNHNHVVSEVTNAILGNARIGIADAQLALASRLDSTETLATISVPTLIIVGEDDLLTPPNLARSMQGQIPHSHINIIPSAGHLSPLEQPERVNSAIWTFLVERGFL